MEKTFCAVLIYKPVGVFFTYIYISIYDTCIFYIVSHALNIQYMVQGYTGLSCFLHVSTIESIGRNPS